jgi:hypothetical protein
VGHLIDARRRFKQAAMPAVEAGISLAYTWYPLW